jgi:uncharacterized membrane protein
MPLDRTFAIGSALRLRGRRFRWLGGWAGKPLHAPLTDVVIGAFMLGALFDLVSFVGGSHSYAHNLYVAASYAFKAGAVTAVLTMLTGLWDWWTATERGSQARRMANTHLVLMVTTQLVIVSGILLRSVRYEDAFNTPGVVLALSLLGATLTGVGATFGGSLVYDYGVNVVAVSGVAGQHPANDRGVATTIPSTSEESVTMLHDPCGEHGHRTGQDADPSVASRSRFGSYIR